MMGLSVTRHRLQVTQIRDYGIIFTDVIIPLKPGSTRQDGASLGQAKESGGP